ncbi:SIMPL domain-containing protein [Frigoribacterium sp. 2-23]|uniref:SIMPL domain-containing protein n=1 Tax=Frigoribacterium sp. 2-23 TaxID=3415006 RepID=UPI003C6FB850
MVALVVEGSVTHRHRAERGIVHLTLGFDGDDREQVAADAIGLHNEVAEQATRHRRSGAATWWTAQNVTTGPVREWVDGGSGHAQEARVVFRSRSRVDVRFQDFDALASWIAELVDRDGVSIDGIDWSLGHERRDEVEREARIAAVTDAVARAGDYATALGLAAPRLETLYEAGLRPAGGGAAAFGLARSMASGPGEAYDLNPADIEVTVTVSADFVAEPLAP